MSDLTVKEKYDPLQTYLPLCLHVQLKFIQIGTFVAFWPAALYSLATKSGWSPIGKATTWGSKIGFLAASAALVYKISGFTEEETFDRSYRIKHNLPQLELDRYSIFGGVAGFAAALPLGGLKGAVSSGFALGTTAWLLKRGYEKYGSNVATE